MKIAITGANGFLGKCLVNKFENSGIEVLKLVRNPLDDHSSIFNLGSPVNHEDLIGVDCVIHTAYDLTVHNWKNINNININGSKYLFEACNLANVKIIVFISSMSAFEDTKSQYGRAKLYIEKLVPKYCKNSYILRPGIIFGDNDGGLINNLREMAKLRILPVVGGNANLYLTNIDDLFKFMLMLTTNDGFNVNKADAISVVNQTPTKFKDLLKMLGAKFLIPVPFWMIWAMLKSLELMGFKLKSGSDNLLSLVNQNKHPSLNDNVTKYFRYF